MIIVYDSRTNNVKRFVEKVNKKYNNIELIRLTKDLLLDKPFHLVTYTTKMGEAPISTLNFLINNNNEALSVSSSGNMNWGRNFALAVDRIIEKYPKISLGIKFEMSGVDDDVNGYIEFLKNNNGDK